MIAYCQGTQAPQVVDPSDLVVNPADSSTSVGDVYNLPAILNDAGVVGGLGEPIAKMNGLIQKDAAADAPEGLLQKYASQIRIGAMAFNNDGSDSECNSANFDPYVTYNCDDADNEDGTYLVQEIGGTTADLIVNINDIKADSWTPLAEAMFNAIGYFTQDTNYVIKADHLQINGSAAPEPIEEYCQANNIVLITDGSSTADLNTKMVAVAEGVGKDADGMDDSNGCGALYGSTYLDDLTYFAKENNSLYNNSSYVFTESPENISTYIVSNGTPRNIGTGECNPATLLTNAADNGSDKGLLTANNPDELYSELDELFQYTLERAASGSAASVIAATRSGEGAVYQAIFWPNMDDPSGDPTVTWVGEVHALMVDSLGQLYEDTVQDSTLNTTEDKRVVFYYDDAENKTKACYGTVDIDGGTCTGTSKDLNEVNYLWSTAEWLADITDTDILVNRVAYMSNEKRRFIFTWNDLNNNGKVGTPGSPSTQYGFEFENGTNWNALSNIATAAGRDSLFSDFGVTTAAELNEIVNWMRGKDDLTDNSIRARQVPTPANFNITSSPANITWRLGDVIHSTPTAVGRPVESFHLLYKDATYAAFYSQYAHRRNVIYFGANDGMLHAVNGGFYDSSSTSFCKNLDSDNLCFDDGSMPELGAELWAYVPYNLQPHLKCLMDSNYRHKYYMDLKPRIFDVKIFNKDADHPGGWGTILVAGMRLGGKELESDGVADNRKFISSYIILDITNPEKKPVLLGELTVNSNTHADMGYTTNIPTVVPMKSNGTDDSEWYLVFGSGPTNLDGTSDQKPRIATFNLNQLTSVSSEPFQILNTLGSAGGSIELSGSDNGFVSDPVTMDFLVGGYLDEDYRGDAIYFGTVEGTWGNWSGKMYRWVTNADTLPTTPDDWGDATTNQPNLLINTGRPISAAPTIGWDGFNYWVYFGTGRFLHEDDKSDVSSNGQDLFFGLKEPVNLVGDFTWATIGFDDSTGDIGSTILPGSRKLVRTDQIVVSQADTKTQSLLTCLDTTSNCLIPSTAQGGTGDLIDYFSELEDFIAGTGFVYDSSLTPIGYTGTDGWYLEFPEDRERNLGQPTLLGGLTTFTTYQPYENICLLEGLAALYGLYFKTGTAWHEAVFNPGASQGADPKVISRKEIGRGLATTPNLHIGKADGAKAIVQTSTGAIVEIEQPTLPLQDSKSGKASWLRE